MPLLRPHLIIFQPDHDSILPRTPARELRMAIPLRPRPRPGDEQVYQLRIELEGILPAIWRRVQLSGRDTLHALHQVIGTVMGYEEELGYHFEIDGVLFEDETADPHPGTGSGTIELERLGLLAGTRFLHQAEHHGDPWRHVVTVESITPRLIGQRLPVCLDAARAAPPSDCSDVAEYQRLLSALATPDDPFAGRELHWLPEHFDPDFADLVSMNAALHRLPRRRSLL